MLIDGNYEYRIHHKKYRWNYLELEMCEKVVQSKTSYRDRERGNQYSTTIG